MWQADGLASRMRAAVPLLLAATATACAPVPAGAQAATPIRVERKVTLANLRLAETSGVAVSRSQPGLLWTHNDSGDGPVIYATNLDGADLGSYAVTRADAVDWEDIAAGPCPDSNGQCLYVGDTGDNAERRASVQIYIVPEPPPPEPRRHGRDSVRARRLTVRYPDRPHDVEALAVAPTGEVLLITKGRSGGVQGFSVPASSVRADSATAVPIAVDFGIPADAGAARHVTGAALSPDGSLLVIRTYVELRTYRRVGGTFALLGTCTLGFLEPQGEAVDFLEANRFVLTSEAALGLNAILTIVTCGLSGEGSAR